jgi:hypothetical protein
MPKKALDIVSDEPPEIRTLNPPRPKAATRSLQPVGTSIICSVGTNSPPASMPE